MAAPAAPAPLRLLGNPPLRGFVMRVFPTCFSSVSVPLRIHAAGGVCTRWVLLLFLALFSCSWIESLFARCADGGFIPHCL